MTSTESHSFEVWRVETARDIATAKQELDAAETSLAEALESQRLATERRQGVHNTIATIKQPISSSLRSRLEVFKEEALKLAGLVTLRRETVANIVYKINDLEQAAAELKVLVSGPEDADAEQIGYIRE
jgi:hypothetical protein